MLQALATLARTIKYISGISSGISLTGTPLPVSKLIIGRALCEDEIRSIQQGATASWKRVITCRNPSSVPIECSYSKTVGVTKSSSETSSSGFSESQELSLTVGMEVGDPWGVAKTSMSASMTSSLGK